MDMDRGRPRTVGSTPEPGRLDASSTATQRSLDLPARTVTKHDAYLRAGTVLLAAPASSWVCCVIPTGVSEPLLYWATVAAAVALLGVAVGLLIIAVRITRTISPQLSADHHPGTTTPAGRLRRTQAVRPGGSARNRSAVRRSTSALPRRVGPSRK